MSTTGSIEHRLHLVRKKLRTDEQTFQAVYQKLKRLDEERSESFEQESDRIAVAYLRTKPPNCYVKRFAEAFAERHKNASKDLLYDADLHPLMKAQPVHQGLSLVFDQETETFRVDWKGELAFPKNEIIKHLDALCQRPDRDHLIHFGVRSTCLATSCTAAVLAAKLDRLDQVPELLHKLIMHQDSGLHSGLFAGLIDPEYALQTVGKMLVDAAYEQPDQPGYVRTPTHSRDLIGARALIPFWGSPLPRLKGAELPEEVGEVVGWIDRMWERWYEVLKGTSL